LVCDNGAWSCFAHLGKQWAVNQPIKIAASLPALSGHSTQQIVVDFAYSVASIRACLIYEQQEATHRTIEEIESLRQQQGELESLLQRTLAAPKAKDVFAAIEQDTRRDAIEYDDS